MRKFRLLLIGLVIAGGARAQYFQHTYGSAQRLEFLESGVNVNLATPVTQLGHIMTGYSNITSRRSIMVTRTDVNGALIPAGFPKFNNRYQIFENAQPVDAKGRKVVHPGFANGNISVWGDYGYTPGGVSTKFFYSILGPGGAIIATWSYALPVPVVEVEATSMINSVPNPNNMIVCGWVRLVAGGQRYPMVMSINAVNGAINWSCVYNLNANGIDWIATDLIESPYPPQAPTFLPEIVLSGHFTRPGFPSNGCMIRLTNAGGFILVYEYGNLANPAQAELNSIDIANDPIPANGAGFVLGGTYNNMAGGSLDAWALKVNPVGGVLFSSLFDYAGVPGPVNNYGTDIMTRINTAGNHEYYLGGWTQNGLFGGEDDVVFKINAVGGPVPFGQFTYGGQRDERVLQLDQYNAPMVPPPIDGLSVFGNTSGSFPGVGLNDFYLVKAYFNGVQDVTCNFDTRDEIFKDGPGLIEWWNANCIYSLMQGNLTMTSAPMQDFQICLSNFAGGGNNARLAATQEISQPGYFPNPVSRESGLVTVTFGNEVVAGVATVELWNSLGQICWTKQVVVSDGQTSMQVELGTQLQGGMYHLKVNNGGVLNNYRIVVQ